MKTIQKTLELTNTYDLSRVGAGNKPLFLDIETTGLSPDYAHIYLIGCLYPTDSGKWNFYQWLAESPFEEREILTAANTFVQDFSPLVHFNGDRFDLPFLQRRCEESGLDSCFLQSESFDLYKKIKRCKNLCSLPNGKQKTIEHFLGIHRDDLYDGGQLIPVYRNYVQTGKEDLRALLLLHNEEDVIGMTHLLPMLSYVDLLTGSEPILDSSPIDVSLDGETALILTFPLTKVCPRQVSFRMNGWYGILKGHTLKLRIPLYAGELRYYFKDYKDYYYLPAEDTAIHKSVAAYVDKEYRKKATPKTCYTRKSGLFIPLPEPLGASVFLEEPGGAAYGEYQEELLSDSEYWEGYLRALLHKL